MALVTIVYAVTADRLGPDLTRMGKVEDIEDDLARMMVADGSARWPTDEERAAYDESVAVEEKAEAAGEDLSKLLKADLLALAADRGVTADESMTKAEIIKAIEAQETDTSTEPAGFEHYADGGAYGPAPAGALPSPAP